MEQNFHIKARIVNDDNPIRANLNKINDETTITANLNEKNGDVATTQRKGIVRFATEEEALEGTSNNTAITPKTLNTVTSTNNASINARIESLENAEDTEMTNIVEIIQRCADNLIDLTEIEI